MINEKELSNFLRDQVKDYLDSSWTELFDGMKIACQNNVTTISTRAAGVLP
jgi:hypothetical protein